MQQNLSMNTFKNKTMKRLTNFLFVGLTLIVCILSTQDLHAQKSIKWLDGTWFGTGHQPIDDSRWSVVLEYEAGKLAISYPSLECSGNWKLVKAKKGYAEFVEDITKGENKCNDGVKVIVTRVDERFVSVAYFLPDIVDGVAASAVLDRDARKPTYKKIIINTL